MNLSVCVIAGAMLLSLSSTACSRREKSPELAALENAYNAGVLTKDEYDAKRAMFASRAARLSALDRALEAGILSKEEYLAKEAAVLSPGAPAPVAASPSVPDAATQPVPAGDTPETPPVSAETQPSPTPAADPQGHSFRMKLAKVVDAQGFGTAITSLSLLIPVEWQSQGATTWNIKDSCNT